MELTNDQAKIELVSRLVKEGAIDFNEAIKLLEVETRIEFIPQFIPDRPLTPWPMPPYHLPIMCGPAIGTVPLLTFSN